MKTEDGFETLCPAVSYTASCAIIWRPRVLLQAATDPEHPDRRPVTPLPPAFLHNFEKANLKDSGRVAACGTKISTQNALNVNKNCREIFRSGLRFVVVSRW
jgi:hypothetical protein